MLAAKVPDAMTALGEMQDHESVEPLINLLNDGNDSVRSCAVRALGSIRDVRAVEPLIDHLKHNVEVDWIVAEALGDIKDPARFNL